MVIESLQMLAAPASTQIEYIKNGGVHQDELALELDDVLQAFLGNCRPPKPATLALGALDRQLDKMSGQANAYLWTDIALDTAEEWSTVRRLAERALADLDQRVLSPAELEPRTRRRVLLTLKDSAVYELVLRHTVEVGHGWGQKPSPLRGFYVLDRVIADIEVPSFKHEALDDLDNGIRLTRELMNSLAKSLKDVTEVEFVSKFLELVDLRSESQIQVRGSRGFVALGPIRDADRRVVVGVYFYAGGRWSRSNQYELAERNGSWAITKFQNVMVS